jgi:hypothetical protein
MKQEETNNKEIYVQNKKLKKVERILFNYLIARDKKKQLENKDESVNK